MPPLDAVRDDVIRLHFGADDKPCIAEGGQKHPVEGSLHFALKQTSFSLYPNLSAALAN